MGMKNRQRWVPLFAVASLMVSGSFAKPVKTDDLSNIIIKGDNRLKVRGKIPEADWSPNIYKDIGGYLKEEVLIASLKAPAIKNPPVNLPEKSLSSKAASPWIDSIVRSPVLTLTTKGPETAKKVEWTFLVKDSHGKPFYALKKKGLLPQKIEWAGFGQGNKPLQVGFDYTYSLSIVDEAGNPQRFSGSPFRIHAFRFGRMGSQVISLFPEAVFQTESSTRFSKEGAYYLAQVKDFLRVHYHKKVDIISYDQDAKFGLARSNAIRDFVIASLNFPEAKVTAQTMMPEKGGGYRHVDIVAK